MPLYKTLCLNGHESEQFCHHADDKGCRMTVCEQCGETMGYVAAYGQGLCFFEQGRERVIHNMGHEPVTISSPAQHRAEMKKRNLELATRRGMPGQWV